MDTVYILLDTSLTPNGVRGVFQSEEAALSHANQIGLAEEDTYVDQDVLYNA